jgi:beta-1,4-mannosyltransferase
VVSSTSWTPDEDFGVLLLAAARYDAAAAARPDLPPLLIVVTGRGPQRAHYERLMDARRLERVAFRTLWVDAADYPTLVGAADVGVSLHTSSSGVDLPMKVVDMFGAGTPALAARFACVGELVAHGANGRVFEGDADLADALVDVLAGLGGRGGGGGRRGGVLPPAPGGAGGYGDEPPALARMRATVADARAEGWEEAWGRIVRPLVV